ncbi:MAG: FAD-dependent oxidoreductase [Elusimicrobiota bacterium]
MIYDLIILGAGPAGITAAVYAARKRMSTLIISKNVGGQTLLSSDIENYTGYQFITGAELVMKFREHLNQFDVELHEGEQVELVNKEDIIRVKTNKDEYQAKTLVLATGRVPRKLQVEGEDEYAGKGVTYCVTCDGPLFAGKDVAVIGGGNAALEAVLQMDKIAGRIYLVDIAPELRADPVMVEKAKQSEKVVIYNNASVEKIDGDRFVKRIKVKIDKKEEYLTVGGVFIEIGSVPAVGYINDIKKNKSGEIFVNCQSQTSIPGIFAAGDVTDVYAKQIIVACGEGAKAALASFEYLSKN